MAEDVLDTIRRIGKTELKYCINCLSHFIVILSIDCKLQKINANNKQWVFSPTIVVKVAVVVDDE